MGRQIEQIRRARRATRIVQRWPTSSVTTNDLSFRHLDGGDRDWFIASIDDEVRHWQGYDDRAVEACGRMFSRLARWPRAAMPVRQLVVALGGQPIGTYALNPGLAEDVDVEIGWWLTAPARGRGLGRASLAALLGHVHHDLHLEVARMGTATDNVRAVRQIEAVGAELVDEREHVLPDGRVVPSRWYHHVVAGPEVAGNQTA